MAESSLCPTPQKVDLADQQIARPRHLRLDIQARSDAATRDAARLAEDLLDIAGVEAGPGVAGPPLTLRIDAAGLRPQGYRLVVAADGIELVGADEPGLFYGGQTLLQHLAAADAHGRVAACRIEDWPHYRVRELMLDLGRAPHAMRLLKRAVRIMARLKLNSLHLHLNDDQLNGLRYDRLPIGSENRWAIGIDDLRQLVAYARRWHVQVVPEIEAWGHAGSVCYHYPHLVGGPGMWGGFSFAIGEELYDVMEQMLDEVMPVLEPDCFIHWGLDEAIWALSKSVPAARRGEYTPQTHVGRLHEIMRRVAERHGRRAQMRIWADHGGRPIPPGIADEVIVEPWMYHECRSERILEKVAQYGGAGKQAVMLGAGISSQHFHGTFGATRTWCRAAMECPNVEGVDICLWESNDLAGRLMGVFGGAEYAWTPQSPELAEKDNDFRERDQGEMMLRMQAWQQRFPDAADAAIRADMGFDVYRGVYMGGPLAGRAVAPTVEMQTPPRPEEGYGE